MLEDVSRMIYDAKFEVEASTNSPSSAEYIVEILCEIENLLHQHLTALRRGLAVSIFINVILLVLFIIGGG